MKLGYKYPWQFSLTTSKDLVHQMALSVRTSHTTLHPLTKRPYWKYMAKTGRSQGRDSKVFQRKFLPFTKSTREPWQFPSHQSWQILSWWGRYSVLWDHDEWPCDHGCASFPNKFKWTSRGSKPLRMASLSTPWFYSIDHLHLRSPW